MIRVEAGLLFYPYDMDESNSPWELGLGFAVSKDKQADYRGKQAAQALIGKDKIRTYAMIADSDRAVDADAEIYHEGRRVGRVTAPMYSTLARKSYAMVQLEPALARPDVKLEVRGKSGSCSGTTHPMPLLDPKKEKRTS